MEEENERPDLAALLHAAASDAKGWLIAQKSYITLSATEAAGRVSGAIVVWVVIALLLAGIVMMLSVAFALWIGQLLNSYALGFLCAGGILLLFSFLFYFLLSKKLIEVITLNVINAAHDGEKDV